MKLQVVQTKSFLYKNHSPTNTPLLKKSKNPNMFKNPEFRDLKTQPATTSSNDFSYQSPGKHPKLTLRQYLEQNNSYRSQSPDVYNSNHQQKYINKENIISRGKDPQSGQTIFSRSFNQSPLGNTSSARKKNDSSENTSQIQNQKQKQQNQFGNSNNKNNLFFPSFNQPLHMQNQMQPQSQNQQQAISPNSQSFAYFNSSRAVSPIQNSNLNNNNIQGSQQRRSSLVKIQQKKQQNTSGQGFFQQEGNFISEQTQKTVDHYYELLVQECGSSDDGKSVNVQGREQQQNIRQKIGLIQKLLDLIMKESKSLIPSFSLIKQEIHNLVICSDESIYDILMKFTNSNIYPGQKRASYKELMIAFIRGIQQWEERIIKEGSVVTKEFRKFSCEELLGKKLTAMDMIQHETEKQDTLKLKKQIQKMEMQIEQLTQQLTDQREAMQQNFNHKIKEKDNENLDLLDQLNKLKNSIGIMEKQKLETDKQLEITLTQLRTQDERCSELEQENDQIQKNLAFYVNKVYPTEEKIMSSKKIPQLESMQQSQGGRKISILTQQIKGLGGKNKSSGKRQSNAYLQQA